MYYHSFYITVSSPGTAWIGRPDGPREATPCPENRARPECDTWGLISNCVRITPPASDRFRVSRAGHPRRLHAQQPRSPRPGCSPLHSGRRDRRDRSPRGETGPVSCAIGRQPARTLHRSGWCAGDLVAAAGQVPELVLPGENFSRLSPAVDPFLQCGIA